MHLNTHPDVRKEMAHAISELLGLPSIYLRTPTYAFQIGELAVNRDGTIDCESEELLTQIMPLLIERGWLEPQSEEPPIHDEPEYAKKVKIIRFMKTIHKCLWITIHKRLWKTQMPMNRIPKTVCRRTSLHRWILSRQKASAA